VTNTILRKSTLALALMLLAAGAGKAFAQSVLFSTASQQTPKAGEPVGGNPDPCADGGCIVAIHLPN
jgi:hypothetical protein